MQTTGKQRQATSTRTEAKNSIIPSWTIAFPESIFMIHLIYKFTSVTRRFRVLIRRRNRPGQSDGRRDRFSTGEPARTGPDSRIRKTGFQKRERERDWVWDRRRRVQRSRRRSRAPRGSSQWPSAMGTH